MVQGIGFMVSLTIYAAYIYRLMTQKLPAEGTRPAMFISVGPAGFTVAALITMGQNLPAVIAPDFMGNGDFVAQVTRIMANWAGIWLWGLAVWFFFVSVGAHWTTISHRRLQFAMTWNSFIFPNTGLGLGTFAVARALDANTAIEIVGAVILVGLIIGWLFVIVMMIRAVILKQVLWPQKQEDRDEGGWQQQLHAAQIRQARGSRIDPANMDVEEDTTALNRS